MYRNSKVFLSLFTFSVVAFAAGPGTVEKSKHAKIQGEIPASGPAILWKKPRDLATEDLFYGAGGEKDAPHTTFTFLKENLGGTNPKVDVVDENGVKWKVKLGVEAQPEVVASRLLWAVGYSVDEDYLLRVIHINGMPANLHRGQKLVGRNGTIRNVRLKRVLPEEKKIGWWRWRTNPFSGTRELNGLRVMMALLNNWDLKDDNNAVLIDKAGRDPEGSELIYRVSDLGASFGTTGLSWSISRSKGNLESYARSRFIRKVTSNDVDFSFPTRPAWIFLFTPANFFSRISMRWIGENIPRADAKWMGTLLAQLSLHQIHEAFRAGGYPPQEIDEFSKVIEQRIADLSRL